MNIDLSIENKLKIVKKLIDNPSFFYGFEDTNIVDLLDFVFDLRTKPSGDDRFKDAYDDAFQHLVNNNDWDLDYTFFTRFNVTEGDSVLKMIEYLIKPNFQASEIERLELIDLINSYLKQEGYTLETSDFTDEDLPVFTFSTFDPNLSYPVGVVKNQIRFLPNYEIKILDDFKPQEKDVFILDFRNFMWWNDYSLFSRCNLIYRDESGDYENFGELKIISNNDENYSVKDENQNFSIILPESFTELDNSYCSLGQSKDFYFNLREVYRAKFRSLLYALKDAALFPGIADVFEKDFYFRNSIIRNDQAERVLREVRPELNGKSKSDLYQFTHLFSPKFGESDTNPISMNFNFEDVSEIPNRICAVIGKNGVGKTQFISGLPKNLAEENQECFDGQIPLFSKLIALSYSPFDTFKPAKSGTNVDYIFCSLRDEAGGVISEKGRAIKFGQTRKRIEELGRVEEWYEILGEFLPSKYLGEIFEREDSIKVNVTKVNIIRRELSSGQRILFETVTNIVAHIRFDSLLLFDEPETHLHPNAIALLMNTIYKLVNQFESFCILTTHSPIIVRELFSKNVYVIDREVDMLTFRRIGIECFGANLSDITEEIFGINEIPKHYQQIIRRLKNNGMSEEEITESIRTDNVPLSLHLRLFIKSLYSTIL